MKKITLFLVALLTSIFAFAYDVEIDGIYYDLDYENKTAMVTHDGSVSYDGGGYNQSEVTIPSIIIYNNIEYNVTKIGYRAFFLHNLEKVILPNSIISIEEDAFYTEGGHIISSFKIEAITPPTLGNRSIDTRTIIEIPDNTKSEYQDAWSSNYVFLNNETTLSINVQIPGTLFDLILNTSQRHSDIVKLKVEGTLNNDDFICMREDMKSLMDIDLSDITNTTGVNFNNKVNLLKIVLPSNLTEIENNAFNSCSALQSIVIPSSVTSIGNSAFQNCFGLSNITIPATVQNIGYNAFESAYNVEINIVAKNIEEYLENNINKLLYDAKATNQYRHIIINGTEITTITIPDNSNSLNNYAFYYCSSLSSITISESITSISDFSFYNCKNLSFINIPNTTTCIGNNAFGYCSSLNSITLPETITSIGDNAFCRCSSLDSIIIPNSVTKLGKSMFSGCNSLKHIVLPDKITTLSGECDTYYCNGFFSNCTSLTEFIIPDNVTSIGDGTFENCSSLASIYIHNNVNNIGERAFAGCFSLKTITIPSSVINIGELTFAFEKEAWYNTNNTLDTITCLGNIPPNANNLGINTQTCILVVPQKAYKNYYRHSYWGQFLNIETIDVDYKKLNVVANNAEWGAVEGDGYYDNGDEATLTATANEGYRFVKWSDEVTDNPRTVVVTQDSTFTAIFEVNTFAITTSVNDDAMGSVTEGGEYAYGTEITLTATANSGYRFAQWSDGNTDNPRTITVTENKTYTAEFEVEVFGVYAAAAVPSMGGVEVILNAKPIEGLVFDHWSDGNTENPRTLTLTEDIELYAYFKVAEATNLETSKISSANIYITNGTLHVENATENYHILDAAGRLIYSGNASTLTLPRGIYLITMGGEVEKIVL